MEQITSITSLRDNLLKNFSDLKEEKITPETAKELSNIAGKVIKTVKTQLDYDSHMGYKNKIEFLEAKS